MAVHLLLPLSPARQLELERRAGACGVDLGSYVTGLLEEQLDGESDRAPAFELPFDQWQRQFQEWVASHRSRNPQVDDSRESIYD